MRKVSLALLLLLAPYLIASAEPFLGLNFQVPNFFQPQEVQAVTPNSCTTDSQTIVNSTYARGDTWRVKQVGNSCVWTGGLTSWVYDGSKYVPAILTDLRSTLGYVEVRSGLLNARLYNTYAQFFDSSFTESRVASEQWFLEHYNTVIKGWRDASLSNLQWTITQTSTYTEVMKTWDTTYSNTQGKLKVVYHFEGHLKHTVTWTANTGTTLREPRFIQSWAGIVGNTLETSTDSQGRQGAFHIKKSDGSLSMSELQWGAISRLNSSSVDLSAGGKKANWIFSGFGVASLATVDPDTYSSNNPTQDGHVFTTAASGTSCPAAPYDKNTDNTVIKAYLEDSDNGLDLSCGRGYFEWDITSIAGGSDVTNVLFKFDISGVTSGQNCDFTEMNTQPNTASGATIWTDIGDGTVFVSNDATCTTAGDNKSVDLGADADADVEAQLSADWWAVGFKFNAETRDATSKHDSAIASEDDGTATPKPTLEVTYTPTVTVVIDLNPSSGSTSISGSNTFTVTCTGGGGTITSDTATNITCNPSVTVTVAGTSSASTTDEKWIFRLNEAAITFTSCASGTCATQTYVYYDVLRLLISKTITGGGAPTCDVTSSKAPTSEGSSDSPQSVAEAITTDPTQVTAWARRGTTTTVEDPCDAVADERWDTGSTASFSAAAESRIIAYYHQYMFTLLYSITDALGICSAPVLTATQLGAAYSPTLGTSGTDYWLDNSQSWSVPSSLSGSTTSERCNTEATVSGTVSSTSPTTAGSSLTFAYTHQYYNNNPSALKFNIYQFGTLVSATTATTFWADVGKLATLVGSPYSNDWTLAFGGAYWYQTSNGIQVYMNTTATAGALPTWDASALTVTLSGTKVHVKMYVHPSLSLGYTKTTDDGVAVTGDTFSGNYLDYSGSSQFISYLKVVTTGGGPTGGGGSSTGTTCLNGYTLIDGQCIPNSQITILNGTTTTQTTTQQAGFETPANKFVESGPLVIAGVIASVFGGAAIFGGVRWRKGKRNSKKDVMSGGGGGGGGMDWGSMKGAFSSGTGKKVKEAFQP